MVMMMDKLMRLQQELKAPKAQRNDFGKYNYRSCEDILQAVKPLLKATGTVLTMTDSMTEIGGRVYVHTTARLHDAETGEIIAYTEAYAREEEAKKGMDGSQITGAASSYARKYALNGLFAIDDNKDSDATNDVETPKTPLAPEVLTLGPKPAPAMNGGQEVFRCDDCGMPIDPVRLKDGKVLTPKEIASRSIAEFDGRQLCLACARARKQ